MERGLDKGHLDQLHDPSGPVWIGPLIGTHASDEVTPNDFGSYLCPAATCDKGVRLGRISRPAGAAASLCSREEVTCGRKVSPARMLVSRADAMAPFPNAEWH